MTREEIDLAILLSFVAGLVGLLLTASPLAKFRLIREHRRKGKLIDFESAISMSKGGLGVIVERPRGLWKWWFLNNESVDITRRCIDAEWVGEDAGTVAVSDLGGEVDQTQIEMRDEDFICDTLIERGLLIHPIGTDAKKQLAYSTPRLVISWESSF